MHRQRLENMRSALDTSAPAAMPHLQLYGRDYAAKKRATTEAAFSDSKRINLYPLDIGLPFFFDPEHLSFDPRIF